MSNYRPDPITIKDGVETIPLPGGYVAEYFPDYRFGRVYDRDRECVFSENRKDAESSIISVSRATHATLTAQADEIERLTKENAGLRKISERQRAKILKSIDLAKIYFSDEDSGLSEFVGKMNAEIAAIDAAMGGEKV